MGYGIHRASLTLKWNTKIYTRLDFRDYPFDQQAIELSIKLLSVRLPNVKKGMVSFSSFFNRFFFLIFFQF